MFVWLLKLHRLSPLRSLISKNIIITSISFLSVHTHGSSECNECTSHCIEYLVKGNKNQVSHMLRSLCEDIYFSLGRKSNWIWLNQFLIIGSIALLNKLLSLQEHSLT